MKKKVYITFIFLLILCCAFSLTSCIDDIPDGGADYKFFEIENMDELKTVFGNDKLYPQGLTDIELIQVGARKDKIVEENNSEELDLARIYFLYNTTFYSTWLEMDVDVSYRIIFEILKKEEDENYNHKEIKPRQKINGIDIYRFETSTRFTASPQGPYVYYVFYYNDVEYAIFCNASIFNSGSAEAPETLFPIQMRLSEEIEFHILEEYMEQFIANLTNNL